jgi:hypothetical protein
MALDGECVQYLDASMHTEFDGLVRHDQASPAIAEGNLPALSSQD